MGRLHAGRDVGIIGGGVAGLALAALLAGRGRRVTVYEAHRPGGKLRRLSVGGTLVDSGPSLFTFPGVWRRLLARLGEPDPLDLRPLPGGLGPHHTPFGTVPLPVPPDHELYAEWRRYLGEVLPLSGHVEALLCTPPSARFPGFLRSSLALGRALGPHPTAAGWLRSRRFPPALEHALAAHALNGGRSPGQASALFALLPGLMAGNVWRPAAGMGALLDALLAFCRERGARVLSGSPVRELRELDHHDTLVSAIDPARLAPLRGRPVPDGPLTVSGVALYAKLPTGSGLPPTGVVTPDSYSAFAAAMGARALPQSTLALLHAEGRELALLLTAPPSGRPLEADHPWVRGQAERALARVGVPGLLDTVTDLVTLAPDFYARWGAPGGAIYGRAWPLWRAGPLHPQPYRLSPRLWQVGSGVH
ncbi:MAG: phytoene desaturase family protein, partial [Deinococcus sp.]